MRRNGRTAFFALDRPLGRVGFASMALTLFAVELAIKGALLGLDQPARLFAWAFTSWLPDLGPHGHAFFLTWCVFELVLAWLFTVLGLRRAIDAGWEAWVAVLIMVPFLRLSAIVVLAFPRSVAPTSAESEAVRTGSERQVSRSASAAAAALIGLALTLLSVVIGGWVLGTYEYGLFVLTPFFIGAAAGYLVNRNAPVSLGYTTGTAFLATLLAALALLGMAMEGVICIVLASPLALLVAWLGGLFGRVAARVRPWRPANAFAGFLVVPFVLALEGTSGNATPIELRTSAEIAAPPDAVWPALLRTSAPPDEPGLVFRLGVAHFMGSEVIGGHESARRCVYFSTGVAVERVTAAIPGRLLEFEVTSEPPAMRELSLYDEVHAPHVRHQLTMLKGSIRLEPLPGGRTRLETWTLHSMRYQPAAYWLPFVRSMLEANQLRMVRQIGRQAEAGMTGEPDEHSDAALLRGSCEAQRLPMTTSSGALTK